MDQDLLRKVQLAQLEIAKEIKRVCEGNGIQYFLDSGSLLGAVRHKAFIPWDDDMDFGMIYDEYVRFLEIAPEKLGSDYFLQSWDTDSGYPFAFAKVLKKGTEYVEDIFEKGDKRNELYVDVFPYYPFPKDTCLQKKQKFWIQIYKHILMMQAGMTPWMRPESFVDKLKVRIMYTPFLLLGKICKRGKVIGRYKKALELAIDHAGYAYFPTDMKFGSCVMPCACFSSFVELPFEDTFFQCPADYDTYLKSAYGDYMQLPPEDKRENHHKIIRVKL